MAQSGFAFFIGLLMIGLGALLTRVATAERKEQSRIRKSHGLATIKSSFEKLIIQIMELLTKAQSSITRLRRFCTYEA